MEKAIKKAIEGGYRTKQASFLLDMPEFALCQVWLDPLFWQALCNKKYLPYKSGDDTSQSTWIKCWHSFIDHLIAGKPIDTFFEELLN